MWHTAAMFAAILFLVVGLVLLVFSADYLVKGAANIAAALGISPLVVGLTVVAFGTSAPELAVSVMSAFKGQADIAVGNVIGSNIFNILVILGISALIIPLVVHRQLIRFDVPVMIFLSVLVYLLSMDGNISRVDGIILFSLAITYVVVLIRKSRKEGDAGVLSEYEEEFSKSGEDPKWLKNIAFVVLGVAGLVIGSDRLVFGAVFIAKHFGVSELIIGLTIVSLGTSLPEVATSVIAALKGEKDIAVGNVVGSNIFNIVSVLGVSSIVAPSGIAVAKAALDFDMLFMIAVAVAALPVFFHGYKIGRGSGFFFLVAYGAYLAYLILDSTRHGALPAYRDAMLLYAAPAAAIALVVLLVRGFRYPKVE
jgi:cation:H+ antiporter